MIVFLSGINGYINLGLSFPRGGGNESGILSVSNGNDNVQKPLISLKTRTVGQI